MIRPITPQDTSALLALADAVGLFGPAELEAIGAMLPNSWAADSDEFWLTDDENGLVSLAYFAPERMTQGTWNLYLIAVRPDFQGQGRGTALLRYIEATLQARGARILLVETSGLASFERTRAFYCQRGYEAEARIRDFYNAGEDKIVFRKALAAPAA